MPGGPPSEARGKIRSRTGAELRRSRRPRAHSCWDHLYAAPLGRCTPRASPGCRRRWPAATRCGALRACTGPATRWAGSSGSASAGRTSWGSEPADEAVRLADLPAARRTTVVVLGHEQHGIPPEALDLLDLAVEIPMVGTGASLNVAVAGSPALYKLAGLL